MRATQLVLLERPDRYKKKTYIRQPTQQNLHTFLVLLCWPHLLEIDRRQAMHAKRERHLTAMMQIMFDRMPDDPLTCKGFFPLLSYGLI